MERARRELSIDMAVRGPIYETDENTTCGSVLLSPPRYYYIDFGPKMDMGVPTTGMIFIGQPKPNDI